MLNSHTIDNNVVNYVTSVLAAFLLALTQTTLTMFQRLPSACWRGETEAVISTTQRNHIYKDQEEKER